MNNKNYKIFLINPPGRCLIGRDGVITERKHCSPPLGIAYLAASLEKNGFNVEVMDMLAEGYEQERYENNFVYYGLSTDSALSRIEFSKPDVIGISLLFSNLAAETFVLCAAIKKRFPNIPLVMGGHHPSSMPREVMKNNAVDYVLTGEADLTFVELCDAIMNRSSLLNIKGLFWRDGDKVIDNLHQISPEYKGINFDYYNKKSGPNPSDIESLPLPAWHLFPMEKYWSSEVRLGASDVLSDRFAVIVTTRGCPHICDFCTSPLMGGYKNYRKRTNEDVITEIRWLKDKYGVQEVQMLDDNFFVSKSRVKDLCKRLIAEFPDMLFSVPSGTEINALDHEMIDLLAQANFYRLVLAIESANPDIQASQVDKNVKLERIPELIQYIKGRDIEVKAFFMIGFPGESKESIHATANYALSLDLDDFALSVVTPLPGTPLFDKALSQGQLRDDFNPNDIRYSISSIKIEGMTAEELEDVRKNTWLELQKRKKRGSPKKHNARRRFTSAADFATAGFIDKERVGFSGYAYPKNK